MPNPVRVSVMLDHWNSDVKIDISPMKFGEGGRARFMRVARSHHAAASGKIIWAP